MIGLNASLSSVKPSNNANRYEWAATHACQTNGHEFDGNYTDGERIAGYNFEPGLQLAADGNITELGTQNSGVSIQDLLTTDADFGDKIGFSMWIKPTWSHSGSASSGNWSNGTTNLILFQMNTSNALGGDMSILAYLNYRSGSSFRNRITVLLDGGTDRAGTQRAMHDVNGTTGTGSSGSSTNSLWDTDNPGNTNTEGYVHLVFTRGEQTGGAAWDVYWNGTSLGMNIDIGTGDDDPQFTNDTANFLGIGTYRQKTSAYNSGSTAYNSTLSSMRIRDFAVFNYELSSSQATALYNSGNFNDYRETVNNDSAFVVPKALPPVLYYPLNHNMVDYMKTGADLSGDISFVSL